MTPRKLTLVVAALAVGGLLGWQLLGDTQTPPDQPDLQVLSNDLATFQQQFNDATGQSRLVLLLSPT